MGKTERGDIVKIFTKCSVFWKDASGKVKLSFLFMGGGQFAYKRPGKGLCYLFAEVMILWYFIGRGAADLAGFFTLGTQKGDTWLGIAGDNSVVMLLMGIFAWIVLLTAVFLYVSSIRDAYRMQKRVEEGRHLATFKENLAQLLDRKFYATVLVIPVLGVCVFNILPIVFMILIAFTNYGGTIVPPELVDWVGLSNFKRLVTLSQFAPTFFKIFGWNLVWAVVSTALNYFAGLFLALLLNKECVKGKAFWRAFPVLAYAIPGFITLLAFKLCFPTAGLSTSLLRQQGERQSDFWIWMRNGVQGLSDCLSTAGLARRLSCYLQRGIFPTGICRCLRRRAWTERADGNSSGALRCRLSCFPRCRF